MDRLAKDILAVETPDILTDAAGGERPARRRPGKWIVVALLVLAGVGALLQARRRTAVANAAAMEPPQLTNIQVAKAYRGSIGYYVEALGTVTPLATVNVYSQVNGTVTAVHYVEGQMVHRGDPLLDIDPRPYEAQLKEALGTLQHDQASLRQAQQDLERYKEASEERAIARQTYDDQTQSVEQYKGTVQNDTGQVEYAQTQLAYCHLTAPITGRVGLRLVDPGNTIFSGGSSPLLVITQLQPISVVFNVAEDDLDQLRHEVLHRSNLRVDVYDRAQLVKLATGRLLTLDNQIDTSTGTVRFRGEFDNQAFKLFPNQFVNTRLLVKTLSDTVLVPAAAIQRNGMDSFVYVVSGGAVSLRKITVLTTEQSVAAVTGLEAGETVSISGFDKLEDGSPVKIQATKIQDTKSRQNNIRDQGGREQPQIAQAPGSVALKADPTEGSL